MARYELIKLAVCCSVKQKNLRFLSHKSVLSAKTAGAENHNYVTRILFYDAQSSTIVRSDLTSETFIVGPIFCTFYYTARFVIRD